MYPRNTYRIRLSSFFIRQLRVWGKREGAAGAALRAMMKVVHRLMRSRDSQGWRGHCFLFGVQNKQAEHCLLVSIISTLSQITRASPTLHFLCTGVAHCTTFYVPACRVHGAPSGRGQQRRTLGPDRLPYVSLARARRTWSKVVHFRDTLTRQAWYGLSCLLLQRAARLTHLSGQMMTGSPTENGGVKTLRRCF